MIDTLASLPYFNFDATTLSSVKDVICSFNAKERSLFSMAEIETSETAAVDTVAGVHFTAEYVFHALRERDQRRSTIAHATLQSAEQREHRDQYPETSSDIRRLLQLAPCRDAFAKQLLRTSKPRRERAAAGNAAATILLCAQGSIY